MKKIAKALLSLALIVGLTVICGVSTSCSSSESMYTTKSKKGKVINRNYKMRGDYKRNKTTYRTF